MSNENYFQNSISYPAADAFVKDNRDTLQNNIKNIQVLTQQSSVQAAFQGNFSDQHAMYKVSGGATHSVAFTIEDNQFLISLKGRDSQSLKHIALKFELNSINQKPQISIVPAFQIFSTPVAAIVNNQVQIVNKRTKRQSLTQSPNQQIKTTNKFSINQTAQQTLHTNQVPAINQTLIENNINETDLQYQTLQTNNQLNEQDQKHPVAQNIQNDFESPEECYEESIFFEQEESKISQQLTVFGEGLRYAIQTVFNKNFENKTDKQVVSCVKSCLNGQNYIKFWETVRTFSGLDSEFYKREFIPHSNVQQLNEYRTQTLIKQDTSFENGLIIQTVSNNQSNQTVQIDQNRNENEFETKNEQKDFISLDQQQNKIDKEVEFEEKNIENSLITFIQDQQHDENNQQKNQETTVTTCIQDQQRDESNNKQINEEKITEQEISNIIFRQGLLYAILVIFYRDLENKTDAQLVKYITKYLNSQNSQKFWEIMTIFTGFNTEMLINYQNEFSLQNDNK
ncbi:Hypothetical_protein [Hexamita inflata]|uniref:Hypothetical_protein n=1 Tax=Hexamita inflata TaxID=28002 RepID=A0AA86UHZ3_9EUKA|nr:Hypothetical protein HINF_LOCUS40186 [Hexamita inflata]